MGGGGVKVISPPPSLYICTLLESRSPLLHLLHMLLDHLVPWSLISSLVDRPIGLFHPRTRTRGRRSARSLPSPLPPYRTLPRLLLRRTHPLHRHGGPCSCCVTCSMLRDHQRTLDTLDENRPPTSDRLFQRISRSSHLSLTRASSFFPNPFFTMDPSSLLCPSYMYVVVRAREPGVALVPTHLRGLASLRGHRLANRFAVAVSPGQRPRSSHHPSRPEGPQRDDQARWVREAG